MRVHSGIRNPQRGSKAQPGGMACSGGTVPSMVPKGMPALRLQIWHSFQKAARIRMRRGIKDFMFGSEFDHASGIHHGNAVSHLRDDGEIVRNE